MSWSAGSVVLTRQHANMLVMTPKPGRTKWPQTAVRLDEHAMRQMRIKSATEAVSLQLVLETLARAWLADLVDVPELKRVLEDRGLMP